MYTPYMTVYLVISLPKSPYRYTRFWPTPHINKCNANQPETWGDLLCGGMQLQPRLKHTVTLDCSQSYDVASCVVACSFTCGSSTLCVICSKCYDVAAVWWHAASAAVQALCGMQRCDVACCVMACSFTHGSSILRHWNAANWVNTVHGWSVGLARTVYMYRIWPYIWWFPCQKYRISTVYIYIQNTV
jgi:hypothetical protein